MIFDIRRPLPDEIDGYPVDLRFQTVLNVFEIMHKQEFSTNEKLRFATAMLFSGRRVPPVETVNRLFEQYISTGKKGTHSTRSFDFLQDGSYIYSSFRMDYGIDLFREKLHWMQFVSLFQGLSEHTKMREVMSIRQRKLPTPDKYNGELIANLLELKAYYALEITQEERERNIQNSLANLARALRAKAR